MTLEDRMARLERQNNIMKLAGLTALLIAAAVVLMGQATQPEAPEEVRGRRLVIVDEDGGVRATLGATDSGARLLMYDTAGNLRLDMDVSEFGPGLVLNDSGRRTRVGLGVFDVGPRLWMLDEADQPVWKAP